MIDRQNTDVPTYQSMLSARGKDNYLFLFKCMPDIPIIIMHDNYIFISAYKNTKLLLFSARLVHGLFKPAPMLCTSSLQVKESGINLSSPFL
jgi:hypothetical protein